MRSEVDQILRQRLTLLQIKSISQVLKCMFSVEGQSFEPANPRPEAIERGWSFAANAIAESSLERQGDCKYLKTIMLFSFYLLI